MTKKRVAILALAVLSLTALTFLRASLLSANNNDLFFYKKAVNADALNLPLPGSAFAFHLANGRFEPSAICNLDQADDSLVFTAEMVIASNSVGMSYNDAISRVIGFMGDSFVNGAKVKEPTKTWVFKKEFQSSVGASFQTACIPAVEQRVSDRDFNVFIVDTVFYDPANPEEAFMVLFKPKPLAANGCADKCPAPVILEKLLNPNWATMAKARWSFLSFL